MGEAEELRVCSRWAPMIGKPEIITGENWISPENNRMRMLMSFSAYIWLAKTNVLSLLPSHFHLSVTLLLFPSPSPGLCPVFLLLDFSHLLPASLISFFFLSPLMFPSIPQRASRFTHIHDCLITCPCPPRRSGRPRLSLWRWRSLSISTS